MAVHYTTIGPIDTVLHLHEGDAEMRKSVRIVAFGWDDAEPETVTGYWVFGQDIKPPGLAFFPAAGITSLGSSPGRGLTAVHTTVGEPGGRSG